MERPSTCYAKSGDVYIAYQVFGRGPLDLVLLGSWIWQIEQLWLLPASARFLSRLGHFARVITFDKRGSGLSDRVPGTPTLEERMDDVRAVMAAVGSERAALFGMSEGGSLGAAFAATYPERTAALVMAGSGARVTPTANYPWGFNDDAQELLKRYIESDWGSGLGAAVMAPALANDEPFRVWYGELERLSGSPGTMLELWRWNAAIDIRDIVSAIRVPTLVIHRTDDMLVQVECGRHLARHIADAKWVELPGAEHYAFMGDVDSVVDEVEEFLTGIRQRPSPNRVLATVLVTDVVGSTALAVELGDARWIALLDDHDKLTAREVSRFEGRLVQHTGDGVVATFDGPGRAVHCALAIAATLSAVGLDIRAGVHTGEIELRGENIGGVAVHIAARVAACAGSSEVLATRTVKDLTIGDDLRFTDLAEHVLKGVTDPWRLYAVTNESRASGVPIP